MRHAGELFKIVVFGDHGTKNVKEKLEHGRVVIRGHSGPENGSIRRALRFVIWSVFLICLENTLFPLP